MNDQKKNKKLINNIIMIKLLVDYMISYDKIYYVYNIIFIIYDQSNFHKILLVNFDLLNLNIDNLMTIILLKFINLLR